jgi:hypothetical protein
VMTTQRVNGQGTGGDPEGGLARHTYYRLLIGLNTDGSVVQSGSVLEALLGFPKIPLDNMNRGVFWTNAGDVVSKRTSSLNRTEDPDT